MHTEDCQRPTRKASCPFNRSTTECYLPKGTIYRAMKCLSGPMPPIPAFVKATRAFNSRVPSTMLSTQPNNRKGERHTHIEAAVAASKDLFLQHPNGELDLGDQPQQGETPEACFSRRQAGTHRHSQVASQILAV